MQPVDDLERKLKEASAFLSAERDESSWQKMEILLDKHLPQGRVQRKLFWICLTASLALVAGLGIFFYSNRFGKKSTLTIVKKTTQHSNIETTITPKKIEPTKKAPINDSVSNIVILGKKSNNQFTNQHNKLNPHPNQKTTNHINPAKKKNIKTLFPKNAINTDDLSTSKNELFEQKNDSSFTPNISNRQTNLLEIKKIVHHPFNPNSKKISNELNPEQLSSRNLVNCCRQTKLYLTVSAGPDLSLIKNKIGKMGIRMGTGLTYNLFKKFSLNAGFYFSTKIYFADSTTYHTNYRPGNGYKMQKVDAHCHIYEIPINLQYYFGNKKQWYATAGLNSFLMKKEKYNYLYINALGEIKNAKYELKNKHEYYYSIYRFGVGYQQSLFKKLSLTFEPYLNIPSKGIGHGKVVLYNSGIAVSGIVPLF